MQKRVVKVIANAMAKGLSKALSIEANTNSSVLAFQPKAPKQLEKYEK